MSKWAGKYVIGLSGNIGTGKSVVRRMLEHLGAYGIDADALSHRAIAKGAPGYLPIVQTFGKWVLGADEQIDRVKLGRLVFNDPEALNSLEKIVHPLVSQAVDILVRRSTQPVIVIEAIKLLESDLAAQCDSLWVTYAPPEIQLARLMKNRGLGEADARQRIEAQPPQEKKVAAANVVIKNVGSFEDTWRQVAAAWQKMGAPAEAPAHPARPTAISTELTVSRGRPRHSAEIAGLINRILKKTPPVTAEDIMAAFGEKAFLLLHAGSTPVGVVGWQVENLISRTTEIVLDPVVSPAQALPVMMSEMEKASRDLQCEASLVFVPQDLARLDAQWRSLGYERRAPQALGVLAWQEAARESMPAGTELFFKQLRQDRILRPI